MSPSSDSQSKKPIIVEHTSSPRFGTSLVTGLLADGIGLALVLRHSGVDGLDDIRTDGGFEDVREGEGRLRSPFGGEN